MTNPTNTTVQDEKSARSESTEQEVDTQDATAQDTEAIDESAPDPDAQDATTPDLDAQDPTTPDIESAGIPSARKSGKVAELEREGEIAADFLETLLDIADLDGDLEVDVEADRAAVAIVDSEDGAAPRRLGGDEAGVLEALQELTRLAVQAETGERSRLMLDVAGHRAGRRSALMELARRVAGEVESDGQRRELDPMSAFERKIIHDQVLAAGLTSESVGEEPHRYVVVLPAS
jgi:spoIIIJ-associated protein